MTSKDFCLVAAIDFGTSLSGYAYSDVKTPENENPQIHLFQCWNSTAQNRDIKKTATCILFDENKQFVKFGYDAKSRFAELEEEDKHQKYYFFDNFKMALYKHEGSLNGMELTEIQGKKMLATKVFTESIKAIKDKLLERLKDTGKEADVSEIRWVLTVPTIWHDKTKLFMKDCAQKAGIPSKQLLIALEPEAASLYCQNLRITKPTALGEGFKVTEPGTKYVVVDIGGGTTDIAMHERQVNGCLKELHAVEGNDVGGTSVDKALLSLFENIITEKLLRSLKTKKSVAYLQLYTELEDMKKSINPEKKGHVSIRIPYFTLTKLLYVFTKESLQKYIEKTRRKNNVQAELKDDKISLNVDEVTKIFKKQIIKIVEILKKCLSSDIGRKVSYIILVGGFAENEFLKQEIKTYFPDQTVITPEESGLVILRGAVLFGHNPSSINPRITRSTYGIATSDLFKVGVHSPSRMVVDDWGDERCTSCFSVLIQQNKSVPIGTTIRKRYLSGAKFQSTIDFCLYGATTDTPLYIDEPECHYIGKVTIDLTNPSAEKSKFDVDFVFGNTTLEVSIEEVSTRKIFEKNIKLL